MSVPVAGIDPKVLCLAGGLAALAFTGLILVLPPVIVAKIIEIVDRVSEKIISDALQIWDEDMAEILGEPPPEVVA